ncbi:MAG: peptide/nickel transport system ATP-binding protein [Solirubrobacteraceae bacterium]
MDGETATLTTQEPTTRNGVHLLSVRDLRVTFATPNGPVRAVRGVSLDVEKAGSVAVVGESGSGKSVSVLAMLGLLPGTSATVQGEARLADLDLIALDAAALRKVRGRQIGVVFQDPLSSLNPVLTIGRQLSEPLKVQMGFGRRQARARAMELLGLVGISDAKRRLGQFPHQLSGGMRQRVMIAMALACEPDLLIADEPTTALDVTIQAQILDLLARLRQELGMALLLITHDLGVAAGVTENTYVMYAGRVVETARTGVLLSHPEHPYTRGLLKSVPRIDRPRSARLNPIPGGPPVPSKEISGCAFAPRCAYAVPRSREERPELEAVRSDHLVACWRATEGPAIADD